MNKLEKAYIEEYGHVPKEFNERINFIKNKVKTNRSYQILEDEIKRIRSIEWETIELVFYLVPKATPRPRSAGGHFYVKGAADNKKFFKEYMEYLKDINMIITPCKFYCTSYLPTPNNMRVLDQILAEFGLIRPIKKPDFDNLAKTYADMIQGTLLYDDALIIEGVSKKYYSVKPRIEIKIKYMKSFDSAFTENRVRSKL